MLDIIKGNRLRLNYDRTRWKQTFYCSTKLVQGRRVAAGQPIGDPLTWSRDITIVTSLSEIKLYDVIQITTPHTCSAADMERKGEEGAVREKSGK
jgi:hypothetical protein